MLTQTAIDTLRDVRKGRCTVEQAAELFKDEHADLEREIGDLESAVSSLEEDLESERASRHDTEIDGADNAYAHACELLRDVERGVRTFDEVAAELSRGRSTRPEFYGGHR